MSRIVTCFGCHYFVLEDHITGNMRCSNGARTWASKISEDLEEIQIDCKYWTEKIGPIKKDEDTNEQMTIDLRLYR
jgi:hypothetical protein